MKAFDVHPIRRDARPASLRRLFCCLLLAWTASASVQAQDASQHETNPDGNAANGAIQIPPAMPVKDQLALINSAFGKFKDAKSADNPEKTSRLLERLTDSFSSADRDDLAATWLNLASTIHECIDPDFSSDNPNYIRFEHLQPPADSDGVRYPAGASPSVITQPAHRTS